ncbi:MAG: DNA gyrase inhibitor YacG [Porticoccaceae bacterium]|nr:DNA gyrase inhibitor YacG [Porticoccaceae bacterium]
MNDKPATLNCPTCKKTVLWTEEFPFRPFCSKRCQQIDFGDWAMERHSIPGEPSIDLEDDGEYQEH